MGNFRRDTPEYSQRDVREFITRGHVTDYCTDLLDCNKRITTRQTDRQIMFLTFADAFSREQLHQFLLPSFLPPTLPPSLTDTSQVQVGLFYPSLIHSFISEQDEVNVILPGAASPLWDTSGLC